MVGVPVGRRSGGQLATTLVATKNMFIFFFSRFFSSVVTFSHRKSARIKRKVDGSAQKLRGGHFSRPPRPFWIFEGLIEEMIESKNLFSKICSGGQITLGFT